MASRELTLILSALKARGNDRAGQSVAESRRDFAAIVRLCPAPPEVTVEAVDAGGVPAEWLLPPGAEPGRTLLFFHGGAYVLGSSRTHRDLAARLALEARARTLSVDYRLAPEHPFPAAFEDALLSYRWLVHQPGVEASRLALAGDSAGAGLALAALAWLGRAGEPAASAVACLSPWVDLAGEGDSLKTLAAVDPVIQEPYLRKTAALYLGSADPYDPRASPLHAELAGLPPTLLQVGSCETLLDDSRRFAERARAAGVEVELEIWPEMLHGWQLYARLLPEGREAIARAGRFLAQRLG